MFNKLNIILILIVCAFVLTISTLYINRETYGSVFIEEVRLADQDTILETLSDNQLIQLGREICSDVVESLTLIDSNIAIAEKIMSQLSNSDVNILLESSNRIIIFLRYQAIYELCPDKVSFLSAFIEQANQND